jgi:hypothetical protein
MMHAGAAPAGDAASDAATSDDAIDVVAGAASVPPAPALRSMDEVSAVPARQRGLPGD